MIIDAYRDGEWIADRPGRQVAILAATSDLTLTWMRRGPGLAGTPLHVHHEHADAFYVLEGELSLPLGPSGEPVTAPAGTFVVVPPNVVHSFVNASDAPASWLNLHAPDGGFAGFLRGTPGLWDSFDPPADGGPPAGEATIDRSGAGLLAQWGVTVVKATMAQLCVELRSS